MPSAKEIKSRIASIKDTQKITNAMYLISSTKLRKAKNELNRTRPYFDALKGEIKRIFRTVPDVDSRYFYPPAGAPKLEGEYACLVITADKGMAGAYNHNVLKIAREMLHEHPETELFVVGEYGRQHFAQAGIPIEKSRAESDAAPRTRNLRYPAGTLRQWRVPEIVHCLYRYEEQPERRSDQHAPSALSPGRFRVRRRTGQCSL